MGVHESVGTATNLPMQARYKENHHQGNGDQVMGQKTTTSGPVFNTVNWIHDHTILVSISVCGLVAMVIVVVVASVLVGGKQSSRSVPSKINFFSFWRIYD